MKIRWILLMVMLMSLALTACGGGDSGDASAPVNDFFNAMAKKDAEKAGKSVCKAHRDAVVAGLEMGFQFGGDDLKLEISGLKFKIQDEKDNEAMVVITDGKLKMTMAGETQETTAAEEYGDPIKVIKEDGKWLICDPTFVEGFSF